MNTSSYNYELHLHTTEVSPCAHSTGAEVVAHYKSLGYRGVVITDHFATFAYEARFGDWKHVPWDERVRNFLSGYHNALAAADENFSVLLGMELQFHAENSNDYLVYGFDEAFLYAHKNLDDMGIEAFSKLARENDLLLVQAHPFRWGRTLTRDSLLDGIEIYNGNRYHDSHNDFAALWAQKFGLLPLSGSDYHGGGSSDGMAPGGVTLHTLPQNVQELVQLLRQRQYETLGACTCGAA